MAKRVKKTAIEPFTDDDKFWCCPRVKPRKDQCKSIIWFNEFDNVKPQLGPAPESAEPHTPKKKGTQELIDGYLTPSTHGKLNESLKENESSERLDGRFESKQALSNSKRPATTIFPEQTTPTKKRKTEVQTLVTPGSRSPDPIHGRASSVSNLSRMFSKSPCPIRDTWNADDNENLQLSSTHVREICGVEGSGDRVIKLPIPEGCTEMCVTFKGPQMTPETLPFDGNEY
ncbi:uncharacterized protein PAC_00081 [Phialocephala subalpina]|uniref:Uncharacterized protein n=1 Tax=Phialocephala subalpina TaxID=576137 RepID=A0A1L7WC20_9HELO|nr:uncharacterized protein PAC_00081 [Phialocephala subalpina]